MDTKVTQVQFKEGLFELSEESLRELQGSKYLNDDLRPTTSSERTWTTYNVGMLWVGMVICITGFSFAAALIAMGFSPLVALLNVLIGNLIVLIPMQLNSHAGTRYGIPFPVFSRITFGRVGSQVPSLVRAVVACGWCSIQCWVAGAAVSAIIGVFSSSWDTEGTGRFIGFGIFLVISLALAWKGSESIKWLEAIGSPVLLLTCLALVVWVITTGHANGITVGEMFFAPGNPEMVEENGGAVFLFMASITSNIAVWATLALNIPDFSRYAKSQKSQFNGQLIGMPVPMAFCAFVGAAYAQSAIVYNEANGLAQGDAGWYNPYDVVSVLYNIPNQIIVFVAAVGVIMATVTTCAAANIVAPANGFANLSPRKISYKKGVIITCLLAFFVLQAWWIYGGSSNYFMWLNAYGTILAPLAAIFIADYFFVKRRRIDIAGLFADKGGRYWYSGGFNIAALIAWVAAFILPLISFFGAQGSFWTFMNCWNYIVAFIIGFVVYVVLMKVPSLACDSFVSEEEHEAFTERA